MHLLHIILTDTIHLLLFYYEATVCCTQVNHPTASSFYAILNTALRLDMHKIRGFFPRERTTILSIVPFCVQTLIKGVEKTSVKYFVKTFKKFKLMFEDYWVGLIIVWRNFNNDWFFFEAPERIKNSIGNDHHIWFILITRLRSFIRFIILMHITQHFQSRGSSWNL